MDKRAYITNSLGKMLSKQAKTCFTAQVKSVEGETCTVEYEGLDISGVRLRPTTKGGDNKILVTPAVDTSVLVGSLSGDLNNLCVLSADTPDSIEIVCQDMSVFINADGIEFNGGKNQGMVLIEQLTNKLNDLVNTFNSHTHAVTTGGVASVTSDQAKVFDKETYENKAIIQ